MTIGYSISFSHLASRLSSKKLLQSCSHSAEAQSLQQLATLQSQVARLNGDIYWLGWLGCEYVLFEFQGIPMVVITCK